MAQLKVLVVLMLSVYEAQSLCANSGMSWLPNPLNCNQFYLCLNGEKVPYSCPVGLVAEVNSKTCVPKRSALDHCSVRQTNLLTTIQQAVKSTIATTLHVKSTKMPLPVKTKATTTLPVKTLATSPLPVKIIETTPLPGKIGVPVCQNSGVFAVANNCAQYFECTSSLTASLKDCHYPQLFNTESRKCEMPALVKCGSRYEPMDPCEYSENHCTKSHCVPCDIRFPSCRGLSDGLNAWSGREGSPYFAICRSQRVVFQGKCSYEQHAEEQIFDPKLRVCVKASYHSK